MKSVVRDGIEPESHLTPKEIVTSCLRYNGYQVWNEMEFDIRAALGNTHTSYPNVMMPFVTGKAFKYQHPFDIFAVKVFPNNLYEILIIEIDGDDSPHSIWDMRPGQSLKTVEKQQSNDRKAEEYVKFFMPDAFFLRLDKDDIIEYEGDSALLYRDIVLKKRNLTSQKTPTS